MMIKELAKVIHSLEFSDYSSFPRFTQLDLSRDQNCNPREQ